MTEVADVLSERIFRDRKEANLEENIILFNNCCLCGFKQFAGAFS